MNQSAVVMPPWKNAARNRRKKMLSTLVEDETAECPRRHCRACPSRIHGVHLPKVEAPSKVGLQNGLAQPPR